MGSIPHSIQENAAEVRLARTLPLMLRAYPVPRIGRPRRLGHLLGRMQQHQLGANWY